MFKWITSARNDNTIIDLGQPGLLLGWEWGQLHPWAAFHVWSLSWVCFVLEQHFSRKRHVMVWMFRYLAANSNLWADFSRWSRFVLRTPVSWVENVFKKIGIIGFFNFLFVILAKFYNKIERKFIYLNNVECVILLENLALIITRARTYWYMKSLQNILCMSEI